MILSRKLRVARVVCCCLFVLGVSVSNASAQLAPERGGFTILANVGVGIQRDGALEESAVGLGGINLGVGGFLTDKLALLFRFSGTNVSYDFGVLGELDQVSGVAGPTVQYWLSDRFNVEAGAGMGFWPIDGADEPGLGLALGFGATIFNRGRHNLQIGFEYAPAFTDPSAVHNLGITFGYQFL